MAHPRQSIKQHADDVWGAANGVAVLNPPFVLLGGFVLHVFTNPASADSLPRVWLCGEDAVVEVGAVSAQGITRHRGEGGCEPRQPTGAMVRQANERGHHTGPVHDGEALFRFEFYRLETGLEQGFRRLHTASAITDFALALQDRSNVRQRRQVAAGPDRTLTGNARQDR